MHEVLLIDDKSRKWYSLLNESSKHFGFTILTAESVEQGLRSLDEYTGTIEAVLLSLTFTAGKMQGIDGLIKIKEAHNKLPVIIFTAKSDNLQLVTECMRLGAYDFFSKDKIQTELLFLQLKKAIEQSLQRKKFDTFTINATDKLAPKPALLIYETDKNFEYYFAYGFDAVACAANNERYESEFFTQVAYEWHLELANALSFYDDDLNVRIRYANEPGNSFLKISVIFGGYSSSRENALKRFEELRQEMDLFMQPKKDFGKTVYYFSPIISENELKKVLYPFITKTITEYIPDFTKVTISNRKKIGFSSDRQSIQKSEISMPISTKFIPKLDGFCEKMLHQKASTFTDIVITPIKLLKNEIDTLRWILNDFNYQGFSEWEQEMLNHVVSSYLSSPSKCFIVNVQSACAVNKYREGLASAIANVFLNQALQVKRSDIKCKGVLTSGINLSSSPHRDWRFIYPASNLTNIFKLPYPVSQSIPGVRSFHPIHGFIPENIPNDGILMGSKKVNGTQISIRIGEKDLRSHLYIMGQTGTGKTTLLYSMIMDQIKAGKGLCVVDPHGDLHKKILRNAPPHRKKDIIRFEPDNPKNKICINLLEYSKEDTRNKSQIVDELFNFFRQEYLQETMGPIFEYYMKNALLLLMDDPDNLGNISDVVAVFQNQEFRKGLLSKCKDKSVVDFWNEVAVKTTHEYALVNFVPYIASKLNQLTMNEFINPIVAVKKSNISFRELIDNEKILLVSLSKGTIGKIGVNILGTVILSRIVNAAQSQVNIPEYERKDFILFVDEFQNFISESLMNGLAENRKFKLSMVLANQTLGQLSTGIKEALLGNAGSRIFFRPGINDVDFTIPYFAPYLTREDMITLPNFRCVGRIQLNNALSLPFVFDTIRS